MTSFDKEVHFPLLASVRARVEGIDNAEGRQRIIVELYDKFFATAFKKTVDKLGIVYTPVEIVDFILNSADELLRQHFGQGLTDEGVHILDGFTGTGTFMTRLLQSGLIEPHDLARKYANELHANEMLLLAYYIAAVNIETTYQDLRRGTLEEGEAEYEPFEGLVLTDTFQSYEDGDDDDLGVFPVNNERINRQRQLPITVIVGNPPYSSGQDSANDNNANEKYPALDAAIRDTYAARSTATLKNSLYDSYIRAIKWASLRISDRGVIAYVTNGGWLDSNTADGMRLTLAEEFSDIHVYNLRGNQRTAGEQSRKEGGKVFGGGSRATVAITLLVKDPDHDGPAKVHYTDIGDYLTREEKLAKVAEAGGVTGLEPFGIAPNAHGDWLNQRRDDFAHFAPLPGKEAKGLFQVHSRGLATSRDARVYNFSSATVETSVRDMVSYYNSEVARHAVQTDATLDFSTTRFSWDRINKSDVVKGRKYAVEQGDFRVGYYRPFCKQSVFFDPTNRLNNCVYQLPSVFPSSRTVNYGIVVVGPGEASGLSVLMSGTTPDLHTIATSQFFPRFRYEAAQEDQMLVLDGEVIDGYRKVDNITDDALRRFRMECEASFTKDDVFFYVYGLLHSPDFRETYAADLKKSLPRIPLVAEPAPFVRAGRRLSELHLEYETVTPFALNGSVAESDPGAPYEYFRAEKMKFAKIRDPKTKKLVADRSTIIYNDHITLSGIPEGAYRYMLGSRSAIEWIMDRYQVKTDKASGIVNDPNDWSLEVEDPRYIIDLLARIVTVSLETMKIVDALPPLDIKETQ
ncbi:type ISP restriction/modification enzyme [Janibacter indicus]|uniref:type ISP restriction/modification enzyme n=1 Tax=Janibacter indicus TaxID=857417 RepID=UPI003D9A2BA4